MISYKASSGRTIVFDKKKYLVTKQYTLSDDDYAWNDNVMMELKHIGMYKIVQCDNSTKSITYDYIEGMDNYAIDKLQDVIDMVARYSKPIQGETKLSTVREMHKRLFEMEWPDWLVEQFKGMQFDCLTHADVHQINIVLSAEKDKPMLIDWERACLAPHMYDIGSWLVNKAGFNANPLSTFDRLLSECNDEAIT